MAKRGLDEPAIRQKIAKSTGGGKAADRATELENKPTYGDSNKTKQRQDLARKQRGDFRKTTSSSPGLHGYAHKSDDPEVKAKQKARGAQRGVLTPNERKQLNMGDESFDIYDLVLEFLCVEGYAEDLEDAESIMVYLEPEAVEEIAESGWHRRNPEKIGTSADPDVRMSTKSSVSRNSAATKSPERTSAEKKSDRRVLYNYYGEGGKKTAIERAKAERDAARKKRAGK